MAKCPHCDAAVSEVKIEKVNLFAPNGLRWSGVSFSCSDCDYVLSVSVDAVAQENDIAQTVVRALRKG